MRILAAAFFFAFLNLATVAQENPAAPPTQDPVAALSETSDPPPATGESSPHPESPFERASLPDAPRSQLDDRERSRVPKANSIRLH